jgi:LmbE family N-acetylglucosaminyl deacetylase
MESKKTILILAPHTDDGELGCGGTIAKFCGENKDVYYVAFSTCRKSLPEGYEPDTLEKEVKAATNILGIKPSNLILFDFDVRTFKEHRQGILDEMIKLREKLSPDMVFVPSPTDIHQDHQVISEEGLRAFKNATILGYEMPWNNASFNTRAFIRLDEKHLQTKVQALKEYHSQKHRDYINDAFIYSLATVRGVQSGSKYAEAFEVIRIVF